jgi:hypothetical protein
MPSLSAGYRERALGGSDLVNEKTTHEQTLADWSIGAMEQWSNG